MKADSWQDSRFFGRSTYIFAGTIVIGLVLLWLSTLITAPPWAQFWAGIASTLFSLGSVGVLYEAFLKRALIHDIQSRSQIDNRLLNAGIKYVTLEPDSVQKREIFAMATTLDVVPSEPLSWYDVNREWLIPLAAARNIRCRIYLPEPTAYANLLSAYPAGDAALKSGSHCSAKFTQYSELWTAANTGDSTLEILYYNGYPQFGLMVSDTAAVIDIGNHAVPGAGTSATYVYEGAEARSTFEWLAATISELNGKAISGSEQVIRTPQQILPLTNEAPTAGLPTEGTGAV